MPPNLISDIRAAMEGITPGPWAATTRQGSWDWLVYQVADPNIEICQPFHDGTDQNELGEANARFIAAAPGLLERCEKRIAQLEAANAELLAKLDDYEHGGVAVTRAALKGEG